MPSNVVDSFAEKTGKSVAAVERLWGKAKEVVKDQYKISETDDRFYALTTGVLKKMLSIEESLWAKPKAKEVVEEDKTANALNVAQEIYALEDALEKRAFSKWEKKSGKLWKDLGVEDWAEAFIRDPKEVLKMKSELLKMIR